MKCEWKLSLEIHFLGMLGDVFGDSFDRDGRDLCSAKRVCLSL